MTGLCLQQTDVTPLSGLHLDRLRKSVQQHEAASAELFSQVTEDGGEIEFLGIAEQTGEDTYTVTRIIGREAGALRGKEFIVGRIPRKDCADGSAGILGGHRSGQAVKDIRLPAGTPTASVYGYGTGA